MLLSTLVRVHYSYWHFSYIVHNFDLLRQIHIFDNFIGVRCLYVSCDRDYNIYTIPSAPELSCLLLPIMGVAIFVCCFSLLGTLFCTPGSIFSDIPWQLVFCTRQQYDLLFIYRSCIFDVRLFLFLFIITIIINILYYIMAHITIFTARGVSADCTMLQQLQYHLKAITVPGKYKYKRSLLRDDG